jgi:hypothetical protein
MKKIIIWAIAVFIFLVTPPHLMAKRADTQHEIKHLLVYIEDSGCRFIRNGKEYSSREARKHLEHKYDYARTRINTTEDFIKYIASQSSLSGQPYKVRCGDQVMLNADWLSAELARFRLRQ